MTTEIITIEEIKEHYPDATMDEIKEVQMLMTMLTDMLFEKLKSRPENKLPSINF